MYQPERFDIQITEPVPSYVYNRPSVITVPCYDRPYTATVSYYNPEQVLITRHDRYDGLWSDSAAIRHELSEIRRDIGDIKRQQIYPTYYVPKQDYSNGTCPICTTSSYENQQNPGYSYDEPPTYVEERPYSVGRTSRTNAPITTYQDHYREPSHHGSYRGQTKRRTTLNELQTQSPSSSTAAQHPRHWVPAASKNSYPNRRSNLSVPHSEP